MTPEELYLQLEKIQRPRGYFFNPDREKTMELLQALLVNRERYGYMACPCRLAAGSRERDRDIICPCLYREPDVAEYGSCFCALYVSEEVALEAREPGFVPERRPRELIGF